jgi:hypothetical protein
MPYSIRKSGSGFKVVNKKTGHAFSKKPMTKEKAKKQEAALHINAKESFDDVVNRILTGIFNESIKHNCKYAAEGCACSECEECKVNKKDGKTLIYKK